MALRRENSQRRRHAHRAARSVLVVCGGTRTEPDYLDGMRRAYRRASLKITVLSKARHPEGLVEHARSVSRRASEDFDEVWCVVDVDDFELAGAVASAADGRVLLAVSNPCFELWLLLHFDECKAHVDGAADAALRLRRHLPAYDKTRLDFADFAAGVTDAVRRARTLDDGTQVGRNPSSGVWKLVSMVMEEQR
jgi:hypothetical protein